MHKPALIIAPDSFKGSLSALAVSRALAAGLARECTGLKPELAPMADGGEGTLDCVAASCPGEWHYSRITAIHCQPIDARWYACTDGLAVIESAEVLGLPLIEACPNAPALARRSSYALGCVMREALDAGMRRIAVGLGGSATNDAGLGMLSALGAVPRDRAGQILMPDMDGLLALDTLSLDALDPRLADTDLRALCDVDNPLLGAEGASRIYGPQKGLTDNEIDAVEAAFERVATLADARAAADRAGSGAAGGLGFALAALGARLESGAQALLDMTGLRDRLRHADLVITGEGRSDRQTLSGKLPLAIARAAAPTPAVLVSGDIAGDARTQLAKHYHARYTLVERAGSTAAALDEPARWLAEIGADIGQRLGELIKR